MIRGWLGAGILVLFLVLGFVVSAVISNAQLPSCALLEEAVEKTLAGDFEKATELGMAAKSQWEKTWDGTAVVADHSPMEDVDALFAEMEIYAKTGEEPHFAACCKELAQRLQAVADAHKFSWWNVL